MSGNQRTSDPSLGKPSVPGAIGEHDRSRAISIAPPPTDDLDAEWETRPEESSAVVRDQPRVSSPIVAVAVDAPAPPLAARSDPTATLMGIAPPSVVPQVPKREQPPSKPPGAAPEERAPQKESVAPAPGAVSSPGVVSAKVEPAPQAVVAPEVVSARAEPAPNARAPQKESAATAPRAVSSPQIVGAPDSVAARSHGRVDPDLTEPIPGRRSRALPIAVAALLVACALWLGLRSYGSTDPAKTPESSTTAAEERAAGSKAVPASPDPASRAATQEPLPTPDQAPAASSPNPSPDLGAAKDGVTVVIVKVKPADARFYYKGKKVGTSPLRVELAPGERRSFEVGHPDFVTRKVVVDGSEPEIVVGLWPNSAGGTAPPKAPAAAEAVEGPP